MTDMLHPSSRLIIVSNRLPFEIEEKEGRSIPRPGSGGLITALAPILRNRGGIWCGWPGGLEGGSEETSSLIQQAEEQSGYTFSPVFLNNEEVDNYYYGFSTEIIWPLFHDLQTLSNFRPEYWDAYKRVNEKFAENIVQNASERDFIWVHDYHLMLVGEALRQKKVQSKTAFFLHIPFPSIDIFMKLPWRFEVLRALLSYDLIGLQTMQDYRNFIQCLRLLRKEVQTTSMKGMHLCRAKQRETRVGAFPISIDFQEFSSHATSLEVEEAAWFLHEKWKEEKLLFSVDRLDYTKGIVVRLEAIRLFLLRYPEYRKKVRFIQLLVPSRTKIKEYSDLKQEVDRLVSEINSQFAEDNWMPIQYVYRPMSRLELLSHYRTSDVALVTSIKDGMNLVSKEYVACQVEKKGVLILSQFAGSAHQLQHGALLVNPYHIEEVSDAIYRALEMGFEEKKKRIQSMQRVIKKHDVFWWMQSFLEAAFAKRLTDFPRILGDWHQFDFLHSS